MLADAITAQAEGAEMANALLLLLNVSIPFSLYTSFDYLGFWLYAVFSLLVAVPLYKQSVAQKVSAISLGVFGVVYHLMLLALLLGAIEPGAIDANFLGCAMLLLIVVVAMLLSFKAAMGVGESVTAL